MSGIISGKGNLLCRLSPVERGGGLLYGLLWERTLHLRFSEVLPERDRGTTRKRIMIPLLSKSDRC